MRWGLVIAGLGFLFSLGFDLARDTFGAQRIIAEAAPFARAFLPSVGVGLLVSSVTGSAFAIKAWDDYRRDSAIADMEAFINAAERLRRMSERGSAASGVGLDDYTEAAVRVGVIGNKYRRWLGDDSQRILPHKSEIRAAHCAEIFRAYGYVRGRLIMRRGLPRYVDER